MFICGICNTSSRAGEKARRVTVETHEVIYPYIAGAHVYIDQEGTRKVKDDPGGRGQAVKKEILVCEKHLA